MERESSNRKRKNDGEEEEEKMNEFFALLSSTRDARDRLLGNKSKQEAEKKNAEAAAGPPSFLPEDFMDLAAAVKSKPSYSHADMAPAAGPSNTKHQKAEEDRRRPHQQQGDDDEGDGLDLKLSL